MAELLYKVLPGCPIAMPIKPPHYEGDVGYDLGVAIHDESITIEANSFDDVRTYVCVELPPGYWGDIRTRSSTFSKRRLLVMSGTIDNGYRGELSVFLYNPNPYPVKIHKGDYLAQLVLMPIVVPTLKNRQNLSGSLRGEKGFGSSGGFQDMETPDLGKISCSCGRDRADRCPVGAIVGNHQVDMVLDPDGAGGYNWIDRNGQPVDLSLPPNSDPVY